jgi:histidyl-tRNA synthetase
VCLEAAAAKKAKEEAQKKLEKAATAKKAAEKAAKKAEEGRQIFALVTYTLSPVMVDSYVIDYRVLRNCCSKEGRRRS